MKFYCSDCKTITDCAAHTGNFRGRHKDFHLIGENGPYEIPYVARQRSCKVCGNTFGTYEIEHAALMRLFQELQAYKDRYKLTSNAIKIMELVKKGDFHDNYEDFRPKGALK